MVNHIDPKMLQRGNNIHIRVVSNKSEYFEKGAEVGEGEHLWGKGED